MDGITHCDDGSMPAEYSVAQFLDKCSKAMEKFGTNFRIGNHLTEPLAEVGFNRVSCKKLKMPIGPWPKVSGCLPTLRKAPGNARECHHH